MLFRNCRLVYAALASDVNRRVEIGVGRMFALATYKFRLALAVGFGTVTALGASSASVSRIDSDHRNSVQLAFVSDKLPQLFKRPTAHFCALRPPKQCPVTDAIEVFNGDTASSVFGENDECFADAVVDVSAKPSFLVANFLHGPASILSGSTFTASHLASERPSDVEILLPGRFDVFTGNMLSIAGGNELCDTHIDAKKITDFDRSLVGKVDTAKQVEPVIAVDQIALAFEPVKSFALVLSENNGDYLATFKGEDADAVHSLETHQPFIKDHRAKRLEHWTGFFVPLKAIDGLSDGTHGHLAGQTEPFSKLSIAFGVNGRLTKTARIESGFCSKGSGSVERPHGFE